MKALNTYLTEMIKPLKSKTGIIVFDIDDTLLKSDPNVIHIYKRVNGKEIALTTEEFAKDPDAGNPKCKSMFDYREFEDPQIVYKSIVLGTPIIRNLRIMDSYINAGYDFCFLTARGCEDAVKKALDDFLLKRNAQTGALEKLGPIYKKTLSHAVNSTSKHYRGTTDAEKKGYILKDLCKQYDKVVFVDDDDKNVKGARELGIPNLMVIKANK